MNNKILLIITLIVGLLAAWLVLELVNQPGVVEEMPAQSATVENRAINQGSDNVEVSVNIPGQPAEVSVTVR